MADGTLMNFVTVDYMSEGDMELALVRWTDNRERYLPELTSRGMLRFSNVAARLLYTTASCGSSCGHSVSAWRKRCSASS